LIIEEAWLSTTDCNVLQGTVLNIEESRGQLKEWITENFEKVTNEIREKKN
jgi:hypothetical protein